MHSHTAGGGGVTPTNTLDSEISESKSKIRKLSKSFKRIFDFAPKNAKIFHKFIFATYTYLSWAGRNGILFYIAQGVSSSFLLYMIPSIVKWLRAYFVDSVVLLTCSFGVLLVVAFVFNTICCTILVLLLKGVFVPLEKGLAKLR